MHLYGVMECCIGDWARLLCILAHGAEKVHMERARRS